MFYTIHFLKQTLKYHKHLFSLIICSFLKQSLQNFERFVRQKKIKNKYICLELFTKRKTFEKQLHRKVHGIPDCGRFPTSFFRDSYRIFLKLREILKIHVILRSARGIQFSPQMFRLKK